MDPATLAMLVSKLGGAAVGTAGVIAREASPEGQALAKQNEKDMADLRRNTFGPSRAEQERQVQDASAQARAAAAGQIAEVKRRQASAGVGQQPDTTTAKIVEAQMKQVGALRGAASQDAAQRAAQDRRDALARVAARSRQTETDVQTILGGGAQAAEAVSGVVARPKISKDKYGLGSFSMTSANMAKGV